jgi:hypothetical protein
VEKVKIPLHIHHMADAATIYDIYYGRSNRSVYYVSVSLSRANETLLQRASVGGKSFVVQPWFNQHSKNNGSSLNHIE